MSSNANTTNLEQFADDHDAALDGLALETAERLDHDLRKIGSLESRGLSDRADAIERDVLAELEAAAPDDPDDGGDDPTPSRRAGREITLPEGLSAAEAAAAIDRLGATENPVIVSADTLAEGFGDGDTPADTMSQTPETQSGVGSPDTDEPEAFDPSGLSLADRDALTRKRRKVATFRSKGMEKRVETLEAEMADLAGVEDPAEIDCDRL